MSQPYSSHDVTKMDTKLLISVVLLTITGLQVSAETAESYLKQRWYTIEIVVFEKVPTPPTPELVTNVVEKRVLPAGTIGMQLSDEELEQIGKYSNAVDFDAVVDELFFDNPWHVAPKDDEQLPQAHEVDQNKAIETKYDDGCWMHLVDLDEETLRKFESHEDWTARITDTFSNQRTRDPRLPDWLPDVWQTFDQNLIDLAKTLGLCDDDVKPLLDEEYLDFLSPTGYQDSEESLTNEQTETLTSGIVQEAFDEFELELSRTALTPQSTTLNLQQTANRLQNNNYRIIDHFSWIQDGRARGTEPNVLVQFGQHFENGFREVEGTIAFSIARFLHLKVDLWRFVSIPQNYEPAQTNFNTPLFFYRIKENRRLALGELHYFDHPKFGVLVQIRRVSIPVELKELVEQLNRTS